MRWRVQFLIGVDRILRSSPDICDTLPRLAERIVPELADWCLIDVVENGRVNGLAATHADPEKRELIAGLLGSSPAGTLPAVYARVLRSGLMVYLPVVNDPSLLVSARDAERAPIVGALGLGAVVCLPIAAGKVRGEVRGVLTCVRHPAGPGFDPVELALLRTTANRVGEAVAYTELYRRSMAASRAKDEFLAMLGHELRNPIAAIIHAVRVLEGQGTPDDPAARLRGIIDRQARHLGRLVEDLLDVARLTAGKIVLRQEAVDLKDVADRCLGLHLATGQDHDVVLDAESVIVSGDPTRLEQILGNLLENALKYTAPSGRIEVSVRRSGDWGLLAVRDSGIGISPEVLPRIFDLFAQGEQPLSRASGGLGIGLTLVRRLVELHGGSVMAHSQGPGQGTLMEVALPVAPSVSDVGPAGDSVGAPARHVLVVEDNADAQDALVALLTSNGHRVEAAANGPEAVDLARRSRPELALIDIGLPGMDGYEVARRLGALPGPRIRLVAVTGYGQPDDRQRAREAGFHVHLVKPVDPDELNRVLAELDGSANPASG